MITGVVPSSIFCHIPSSVDTMLNDETFEYDSDVNGDLLCCSDSSLPSALSSSLMLLSTMDETITSLCLSRSSMGSKGLATIVARSHTMRSLQRVDLSFCCISCDDLPNLQKLLQTLRSLRHMFLLGNFRKDILKSEHCIVVKEEDHVSEGNTIVDALCREWEAHPSLSILALDPWLTCHHARYADVRRERMSRARQSAMHRRIEKHTTGSPLLYTTASPTLIHAEEETHMDFLHANDDTDVSLRRTSELPLTMSMTLKSVPVELLEAVGQTQGYGQDVDMDPNLFKEENKRRLVTLQVDEHQLREKLLRREVNEMESVHLIFSQEKQSFSMATTSTNRRRTLLPSSMVGNANSSRSTHEGSQSTRWNRSTRAVQRQIALVDLEKEVRLMNEQKEEELRRRILSKLRKRIATTAIK